jgi:hypothetical protein
MTSSSVRPGAELGSHGRQLRTPSPAQISRNFSQAPPSPDNDACYSELSIGSRRRGGRPVVPTYLLAHPTVYVTRMSDYCILVEVLGTRQFALALLCENRS